MLTIEPFLKNKNTLTAAFFILVLRGTVEEKLNVAKADRSERVHNESKGMNTNLKINCERICATCKELLPIQWYEIL